jgi:hypothetical protein
LLNTESQEELLYTPYKCKYLDVDKYEKKLSIITALKNTAQFKHDSSTKLKAASVYRPVLH